MIFFRTLLIILIFFSFCSVNASEDADAKKTEWGDSSVFSEGFSGQEPVTDSKLKKTIEKLKERNLTKKQRKIREEVIPLSPSLDAEHFENFVNEQDPENQLSQSLTVMIPTGAYSEQGIYIPAGYYKLSCRKLSENEYVLDLSQGNKRFITVEAQQTQQDLEQDSISFCNAEIIDDNRIRLMYGSIDLNLVGYIYLK